LQCERCCSVKDAEPPTTQSSDRSILTSRFFAQTNVHDIPSEKLNVLSADERSEGYYDLHGVSLPAVQETPELVAEKLEELDQEMFMVEDRRAFEMATEIDPDYVRSLRLRFLRAENYDVQRAATRFALNFAFRLDMFGEHVLGRDILLTDLTKTDRSLLDTGFMQVTKGKDRAGRSFSFQIMRRLGKEPPADSAVSCETVLNHQIVVPVVSSNIHHINNRRLASSSFVCSTWEIRNIVKEKGFFAASTWSV
jgi:hypothetical protein